MTLAGLLTPPPNLPFAWHQQYDPLHRWWLSAACAALPLSILLALLLIVRMKAHWAGLLALGIALVIAIRIFGMPLGLALRSTGYGALYGIFPIFWIIFPVFFLYRLTVRAGRFALLQTCLLGVTADSRMQLLLIAFALGAFFEGAAGFGTPVAVCATLLVGLGFQPLQAAGLSLLANTAPVAFGGLGIPVVALHGVTGLDLIVLTRILAVLIAPFCVLLPFCLIYAFCGWRRTLDVWPPILITGLLFGTAQLSIARFNGPWLVDIVASVTTMSGLMIFLRFWKPREVLDGCGRPVRTGQAPQTAATGRDIVRAALPWVVLAVSVVCWGTPRFAAALDAHTTTRYRIDGLHGVIYRAAPIGSGSTPEPAVFLFNGLSATGSGIFLAAIVAAFLMKLSVRDILRTLVETAVVIRFTLLTVATLMGLGFLTRFCGMDATLGLAVARTHGLYPLFGTLIGWLGTASTGSDTSSNVLFGNLQELTAQQLGISPSLMAAANSAGGTMGKMMAPQSVVVASTATGIYGQEGTLLRFAVFRSLALAFLMGILVLILVKVPRFSSALAGLVAK